MTSKFDARQTISHDLLDQLAPAVDTELDNLLRGINKEVTPPLRLSASAVPNLTLNVGSIFVTNPETGRNRTIPVISNTLPNFTGGTVVFPAASGGTITVTPGTNATLTISNDMFLKVGINLDATGNMSLTFGVEAATIAAATAPPSISNTFAVGYVVIRTVGPVVQNVLNSDVYQNNGGGGGGSGSGDANSFLETLKNLLNDSWYEAATANIFSIDEEDKVDPASTGIFSLVTQTFVMDTAQTMVSTQNLDPEFLLSEKDVERVQLAVQWKLAAIDTAAAYAASRDGGLNWQALTMERVDTSDTYIGEMLFSGETDPYSDSVVTTTSNTDLTNAAGLREALAVQITLAQETYVSGLSMFISRLGTIAGNYRLALYSNSAGLPSVFQYLQGWQTASTVPTSATQVTWAINQTLQAGTYHIVIETDADYKTSYSVGVNALRAHGPAGSNIEYLDGGVWFESGPISTAYAVVGTIEDFTAVLTNALANNDAQKTLNQTTQQRIGQQFTLASASLLKRVRLELNKLGAPTGSYFVSLVKDSAGTPSTNSADILCESNAYDIGTLSVGNNTVDIDIPEVALAAGTYHIVVRATYTAFSAGVNELRVREDQSAPSAPFSDVYNGTAWSTGAPNGSIGYVIYGRPLDLRVRITASANDRELLGLGLLYDEVPGTLATGVVNLERWDGTGALNQNEFTLTQFIPNPDLLVVYYVQGGQAYRHPAFSIDGQKLVFPVNSFDGGGDSAAPITLWFDQTRGGAFDNSDRNAALLAGNHLGSTDSSTDRSSPGRGIFLRSPDGTLFEVAVDDSGNVVTYSV